MKTVEAAATFIGPTFSRARRKSGGDKLVPALGADHRAV
jgi:hypothetical protein